MNVFGYIIWFFWWLITLFVCPWCGTPFPLFGKPKWGNRTKDNKTWCKHCGRKM